MLLTQGGKKRTKAQCWALKIKATKRAETRGTETNRRARQGTAIPKNGWTPTGKSAPWEKNKEGTTGRDAASGGGSPKKNRTGCADRVVGSKRFRRGGGEPTLAKKRLV